MGTPYMHQERKKENEFMLDAHSYRHGHISDQSLSIPKFNPQITVHNMAADLLPLDTIFSY